MGTETVTLRCGQVWQDDKGTYATIFAIDESRRGFIAWVAVTQSHRIQRGEQAAQAFVYDRKLVYDPYYAIPAREHATNDRPGVKIVPAAERQFVIREGSIGSGYGAKPSRT